MYFVHHAEVILLRAQDGVIFPRSMYSKFTPDNHGPRFSTRRRGEGIVSRASGGVVWIIFIFVQNDREKKTKSKKQKKHC